MTDLKRVLIEASELVETRLREAEEESASSESVSGLDEMFVDFGLDDAKDRIDSTNEPTVDDVVSYLVWRELAARHYGALRQR